MSDPTQCAYAPPGEYMKDHSFVYNDGWYHSFNISGTQGCYHGYYGKWYRTGAVGKRDYWKLGFTEIEGVEEGAFRIVKPSCVSGG